MRDAFGSVPGTRALLRTGIYWFQEALGFAMTQRPELLTLGEKAGKWNIRRQVRDRDLRRRLTPKYRLGCKRVLFSDKYFRAIDKPHSELVTESIARITPHGIVTADGKEREVDVIVFATGFHVTDSYTYVGIKGPGGEDLVDRWNREGVQAHRGIAVADMPNLFFLLGPNTGLGHNSVVFMIESQIGYVAQAIDAVDKAGAQALAPSRWAQDTFNAELQQRLQGAVWSTGGCSSWYLDEHGKNRTLWSGMTWQYWLATRSLKRSEYRFSGVASGTRATSSTPAAAG
jgi:cation diffusion facilitator CzcD-associated flavoprotein CzcO